MTQKTILITGGYGCIGAAAAKWLLSHSDANLVIGSRRVDSTRTERVFDGADVSRMQFVELDVQNQSALEQILQRFDVTHVAHMAALQTPDCNAHRDLGLQINLGGTQNMIEAIKSTQTPIHRFIYASSVAVYGPRDFYAAGQVPMLAPPQPVNVYGVWKLAGERISEFFWQDTGIPTISLRPGVLYGPGRDAGLTSTPTTAMKCVALDLPYEIPFRTQQDYLYSFDVGAAVGTSLLAPFDGYGLFTLPSLTLTTQNIFDSLRKAAEQLGVASQFKISIGDGEVPFICELDYEPFNVAFPGVPRTPLDEAVHETLALYLDHVNRGWLTPADVQ